MISEFGTKRRILFFPKAWANSVARWICGIASPRGTIQIKNQLDPGGGSSLELDVNVDAVIKEFYAKTDRRAISEAEMSRVKHMVRGFLDGITVMWSMGHIRVSAEWVEDVVEKYLQERSAGDEGDPTMLESGFSGVLPLGSYSERKTDEAAFGGDAASGAEIYVLCRGADGGEDGALFFRKWRIGKDGTIRDIGPEVQAMGVYTNQ